MRNWLFFLGLLCFNLVWGQDYHYWSEIYGTKASGVGGAAFSGLHDNSAVFYNPAAMAFVSSNSISVNATTFRFRFKDIENGLGKDLDFKNSQFVSTPQLISGLIPLKNEKFKLGYSFLTKSIYHDKMSTQHEYVGDVITSEAGNEKVISSLIYSNKILEYWGGISFSFQMHKNHSIGALYNFAFRDHKYHYNFLVRAFSDNSASKIPRVDYLIDMNSWNVKGVFKVAYTMDYPKFRLGIVGTLPSFRIMGNAKVQREFAVINLPQSVPVDVNFSSRKEGLKMDHRFPGSIALGVSGKIGKKDTWIHFGMEYFFAQNDYTVFDGGSELSYHPSDIPDSVIFSLFGNQNFVAMTEAYKPVLNFSLGSEIDFTKWKLLLGFRTDFDFNKYPNFDLARIRIESSKWFLMHFSGGMSFKTKKGKRITLALEYGLTPRRKFYQIINFSDPNANSLLLGERTPSAYITQHSIKFNLGIEVNYKKQEENPAKE